MKKKIVFVINYFYPDFASTGQLMTELCLHLQHDFDVTVIAAMPENMKGSKQRLFTEDKLEQIRIVRIYLPEVDKSSKWSRLRYISAYFFSALWATLRERKTDIIYTISTPPVLGGLLGTLGKLFKGAKHIYNIQDFNPEQAEVVKYTKGKTIFRIARMLDKLNCRCADHVVTVGMDMQETLIRRFGEKPVPRNSVINNWTDEADIVPLSKEHPKVKAFLEKHGLLNKFIIMYSGNLGLYYDLVNLMGVTLPFKQRDDLAFVFIGEGAVKKEMVAFAEAHAVRNCYFLPFEPKDSIKYSLNAADVHLVVNQKGIKGVSVPSKIYGVMAAGKPVLGVLEQGSEAHRLIAESRCGVVCEPGAYDDIVEQIDRMLGMNSSALAEQGMNGRVYLEQHLGRAASMNKYKHLLKQLTVQA
ncbi:glycosyltransferase family 4 protein [Paenibacillus whitsoniae]|uniref:Glycosyltransferase WbuB n=1 Tax=Paenibacillus whitsoniae TaxID=2496558 RepID=A0A3S0CT48_9BACL|nr:glycosyltransferase family 4 protein [Paenibacillus whitsoniae]RTE08104.1 glycosyltransferase WbuB [Paenibacillus whitsoniae]